MAKTRNNGSKVQRSDIPVQQGQGEQGAQEERGEGASYPDFRRIVDALKVILKQRKLRYREVAQYLGTSETTVKRMLRGIPCNMAKIFQICELCGISFFDLMESVEKPSEVSYFLTEEQETHFAARPGHLAVFRQLKLGRLPADVQEQFKVTDTKWYKVLRQLESLGLLEVLPGNQVIIRALGMLRVREDGPFARQVTFGQNEDFLRYIADHMRESSVCFHSVETFLTREQIQQLVDDIHQLGRRYRILAQQSQRLYPANRLESVRWLLAFSKYETDWTKFPL